MGNGEGRRSGLLGALDAEADGFGAFEEELGRLRVLDAELAAFEFMRPLYDHGGAREPDKLRDPEIRTHVERRVAALGGDPNAARAIFDDPEGDHDWGVSAEVDLAASDEAGEAVVRVTDVGSL